MSIVRGTRIDIARSQVDSQQLEKYDSIIGVAQQSMFDDDENELDLNGLFNEKLNELRRIIKEQKESAMNGLSGAQYRICNASRAHYDARDKERDIENYQKYEKQSQNLLFIEPLVEPAPSFYKRLTDGEEKKLMIAVLHQAKELAISQEKQDVEAATENLKVLRDVGMLALHKNKFNTSATYNSRGRAINMAAIVGGVLLAVAGLAVVVAGIALCFTGVGIPVGIAAIPGGVATIGIALALMGFTASVAGFALTKNSLFNRVQPHTLPGLVDKIATPSLGHANG